MTVVKLFTQAHATTALAFIKETVSSGVTIAIHTLAYTHAATTHTIPLTIIISATSVKNFSVSIPRHPPLLLVKHTQCTATVAVYISMENHGVHT